MLFTLYISTKNSVDKRPWADHKSVPIAQSIDRKIVKKLPITFSAAQLNFNPFSKAKANKKKIWPRIELTTLANGIQHATAGPILLVDDVPFQVNHKCKFKCNGSCAMREYQKLISASCLTLYGRAWHTMATSEVFRPCVTHTAAPHALQPPRKQYICVGDLIAASAT